MGEDELEFGEEFGEEFDERNESRLKDKRKSGCLVKIVALIVLLAFLVISVPNFPYLLSSKLNFLDENKVLQEDELVRQCKPAVVSIEATAKSGIPNTRVKRGTGFNISPTGTIITNQHLVAESGTITICFGDGTKYYAKQYETIPGVDLAIINIGGKDLPTLALNTDDRVQKGDTVTIIGNPLGFGGISQRGEVGQYYGLEDSRVEVFDIDIAINPGNSGSPVIDTRSRVVGIIFASSKVEINGKEELRALAIPVQALSLE
jgi:serine protease Do